MKTVRITAIAGCLANRSTHTPQVQELVRTAASNCRCAPVVACGSPGRESADANCPRAAKAAAHKELTVMGYDSQALVDEAVADAHKRAASRYAPSMSASEAQKKSKFAPDDRIASNWGETTVPGEWYLATVKKVNFNGSVDIIYDSGDPATYNKAYMEGMNIKLVKPTIKRTKASFVFEDFYKNKMEYIKPTNPTVMQLAPLKYGTDLQKGWAVRVTAKNYPVTYLAGPYATKKEADAMLKSGKLSTPALSKLDVAYGSVGGDGPGLHYFHELPPPK